MYDIHLQFAFRQGPSPMVTVAVTSELHIPLGRDLSVSSVKDISQFFPPLISDTVLVAEAHCLIHFLVK